MAKQSTSSILMVRPVSFESNRETAVNNFFQNASQGEDTATKAMEEFDAMVDTLRKQGVEVLVLEDTPVPKTPDAVFPNNWISTHANANIGLYPMFAENRRLERREEVLDILDEHNFEIEQIVDYSEAETENIFLEGTGSMILDRENEMAYACLSERTDEELFIEFCEDFEFTPIIFKAFQKHNGESKPIYHTNVMMSVGTRWAVVCLESISDKKERKLVLDTLLKTGKEVVSISTEQMNSFAGNCLELTNEKGEKIIAMSKTGVDSLTTQQKETLSQKGTLLPLDVSTIEQNGGGSVRCMIAEIFLPKLNA